MNTEEQLFMWCTECFIILFTLRVCVVHEPRWKGHRARGPCVHANVCVFAIERVCGWALCVMQEVFHDFMHSVGVWLYHRGYAWESGGVCTRVWGFGWMFAGVCELVHLTRTSWLPLVCHPGQRLPRGKGSLSWTALAVKDYSPPY